jgi:hypothetical protein
MNLPKYTAGFTLYRATNVYHEHGASAGMEFVQMTDSEHQVLPATKICEPIYNTKTGYTGEICYYTGMGGGGGKGPVCYPLCKEGFSCCAGNICTDTDTDSANCGGCGVTCLYTNVYGGYSVGACHNGKCIDIYSDQNNCGKIGNTCTEGNICCNGSCLSTTDYINDSNNCGSCGFICEETESCCNGTCCSGTCCNGTTCSDTESDSNNCGTCGNSCMTGQNCCNAMCCSGTCCGSNCCTSNEICCNGNCMPAANQLPSSSNYILFAPDSTGACQNIEGLTVTLQVSEEMSAGSWWGGFSVQLNAYPPNSQTIWMQYVFIMTWGLIETSIQYWDSVSNQVVGSWNYGFLANNISNTLSAGQSLIISLNNDPSGNGNIIGANFMVTDPSGYPMASQDMPVPSNFQLPMQGFEVNVVGPDNGNSTGFSSGAGLITYETSGQQLCIQGTQGDLPGEGCTGVNYALITAETSNISYGSIPCCGSTLWQNFSS